MKTKNEKVNKAVFLSTTFLLMLFATSPPWANQMATMGSLDVTDSGAGVFSIPVALPPSTGAADPSLRLEYRSSAQSGLFGVGWTLKGISSITRCTKNYAEDGDRVGVRNDSTDLYCLDGEKLRLVSGTYGANGAQYKTAREGYARITSFGTAGSGPQWFKVELKDGRIQEFGNTVDSRLDSASSATVRTWMLNASRDRSANGNAVQYGYTKNTTLGEQILASMQYPNGYLDVAYETRPADDQIVAYDNGLQLGSTNKRAVAIRVYSEPVIGGVATRTQFKEYRLGYMQSGSTRRSLLTSIQECGMGGAAAKCLPALTFGYSNASLGALNFTRTSAPAYKTAAIDLRGDGKPDLIQAAVGGVPPYGWSIGSGMTLDSFSIWDINSDGLVDFEAAVSRYTGTTDSRVLLSNGTAIGGTSIQLNDRYYCHGDYDGDGRTDSIGFNESYQGSFSFTSATWVSGAPVLSAISLPSSDPATLSASLLAGQCWAVDLNGDGRTELLAEVNGFVESFTFDKVVSGGITAFNGVKSILPITKGLLMWPNNIMFGDFNGDGKTDEAALGGGGLSVSYSTGTGWTGISIANVLRNSACVADFNGDGRADIFLGDGTLWLSTSTGFWAFATGTGDVTPNSMPENVCVDLNGDGKADLYSPRLGAIWSAATPGPTDRLIEVNNGLGQRSLIEYKPLTDSTVYTKGTGAVFPKVDIQNAGYVVSRKLIGDGRGGLTGVSYRYAGLRSDLQRNGTIGFEKITSTNEITGINTETAYRQDYPYIGQVASVRTATSSQLLSQQLNSYVAFDLTNQYARVHLSATDVSRYDLNGVFVNRVRETYGSYDAYGNAWSQTTSRLDAAGLSVLSAQSVENTFVNDTARWLLGQLVAKSTTSSVSSSPISATLGVADPPAGGAATLSPNLTFSSVSLSANAVLSATLTNTGGISLSLVAPTAISVAGSDYSFVSTTCATSLAAGASCTVTVKFAPTAVVARTGSLTVITSAGALTSTLSGTGVQAASATITGSPASVAFGAVNKGGFRVRSLTITNASAVPATGLSYGATGGGSRGWYYVSAGVAVHR